MVRWGFIGCGDVVEHKSGKPFWVEGQSEVVAVASRRLESAKGFAARNGITHYYDDAKQLIENPLVDAVYIATPPSTHMPYATLALKAGKAVYVEKPMGIALAECEAAVALAAQQELPLFVAYYRRALPYFKTIKQLLESGEIGKVQAVSFTHFIEPQGSGAPAWKQDATQAGGGLFYDVGCHALDILDYLLGPVVSVQGVSKALQGGLDDTVACQLVFESGALGTALWCFETGATQECMQFVGTKGRLTCKLFGTEILLEVGGLSRVVTVAPPTYMQAPMIQSVIAQLQGCGQAECTGEIALRTAKVMQAIIEQ